MAVIVCHGLQSYFESHLGESRIHRLMMPSTKPQQPPIKSSFLEENSYKTPNPGWSSIEALSNVQKESKISTNSHVVRLSPKSLELCTEKLGNETGSDMIESDIELLSSSSETNLNLGPKIRKAHEARSFPPPLTTIRGSESIRVRSHREGGRLVLQLTTVSSCFQAQRSHGRLRLCFSTHHRVQDVEDHNENEVQEKEEGVDADNEHQHEHSEHTNSKGCISWRLENNYEGLSRCKEGDHENNDFLISWVASS